MTPTLSNRTNANLQVHKRRKILRNFGKIVIRNGKSSSGIGCNCLRCTGHSCNGGLANVGFGQVKIVADDGDQRRRSEGGEKASEERHPCEMKRHHVRLGQAVHFADHGLVLGVHRQLELGRHHRRLVHSAASIDDHFQRINVGIHGAERSQPREMSTKWGPNGHQLGTKFLSDPNTDH